MTERGLYFIALIPPSPIFEEFQRFKELAFENFGTKASLNSPPHLTLHMPFQFRKDREENLVKCIQEYALEQGPLKIEATEWGVFKPRVVFVHVEKTEALTLLQAGLHKQMKKDLSLFNANYKDQVFHPHLTVAFRDLKKNLLDEAFSFFSKIAVRTSWMAESVYLLKHNGAHWETYRSFSLGKPTFEL